MSKYSSLFTGKPAAAESKAELPAYTLLFVDDEPNVLKSLIRVFRQEKYHIHTAGNAEEALQQLARNSVQLIISDYKMPGMNGADLLKKVKATYPDTIRIMLTGHADANAVMGAINEGAVFKFILKPWNDDDLRVTVGLALEQYDLRRRNEALRQENQHQAKELQTLAKLAVTNRSQLAIFLHKKNLLNEQQVQEIYKLQQARKLPVIKLILEKDWVSEKQIHAQLRKDLLMEEAALAEFQVDAAVRELIPHSFCTRQWVVPLKLEGRRLVLAMADPMDEGLIDDLRFSSGLDIKPVIAPVTDIEAKIAALYGKEPGLSDIDELMDPSDPFDSIEIVLDEDDDASLEELLQGTDEPPAIRLANAIIIEAVRLGVSDIHIQPRAKNIIVRYRIDGVLHDKIQIPTSLHMALISRIKVMAELDITERRRPQDGRITVKTPLRIVDLRISTLPTLNGEKIVMRVLDRNASIHRIEELGLSEADQRKCLYLMEQPQGIVLATGPTGSGKTTTLYSFLQHNATATKNYVTIEDPVEFYMDMAGQVYVRDKIGLTFPSVLRAILRQDPDVILLGEIRDEDTAEVAFDAASTGHLVFSTLHTNSALATLTRLLDLGLKPHVVAGTLQGIIAQRLLRRLCPDCRVAAGDDHSTRARLGPVFATEAVHGQRSAGCDSCGGSGYRGRVGIYEVLVPDDTMRDLITGGASRSALLECARSSGMRSLLEDAAEKVNAGLTTLDEVLRVLGPHRLGTSV